MLKKNPFLMRFTEETEGEGGTATAPSNEDQDTQEEDSTLGEPGKKALQAERRAKAAAEKRAAELAAKVKEYEDAQKSAEELATERLAQAQKEAEAAQATLLRYQAAERTGLPLSMARRLQGSDLDELVADAEDLKASLGADKPRTPKPDPTQGGTGYTHTSNADLFADALEGHL